MSNQRQSSRSACRDCGGTERGGEPCPKCGSCCECYCSEPLYGDQAYTGICDGCGGYEECYCQEA